MDPDLEALGERVDHRHADAVQSAGDLVASASELAACMQDGEDHFQRRAVCGRVQADRDTPAVVGHRDASVGVQGDDDAIGLPGQRLVDRVVDYLPDEVMQPTGVRGPDVHARTAANRFEAFEDLDLFGAIGHVSAERAGFGLTTGRNASVLEIRHAERCPPSEERLRRGLLGCWMFLFYPKAGPHKPIARACARVDRVYGTSGWRGGGAWGRRLGALSLCPPAC